MVDDVVLCRVEDSKGEDEEEGYVCCTARANSLPVSSGAWEVRREDGRRPSSEETSSYRRRTSSHVSEVSQISRNSVSEASEIAARSAVEETLNLRTS